MSCKQCERNDLLEGIKKEIKRKEFWLTRDKYGYCLWKKKPQFDNEFKEWIDNNNRACEAESPDIRFVKIILNLKKHLPTTKKGIIKITLLNQKNNILFKSKEEIVIDGL